MWRTTPMHRVHEDGELGQLEAPELGPGVNRDEVQALGDGVGPVFHRRYAARIRDARLSPEQLMARLAPDLDQVAPSEFASFQKVHGKEGEVARGHEYVVRMPGPWDGPVRVVEVDERRLRLATLEGHLEAGQIEFRASRADDGMLLFEVESWARSGDRLSDVLYDRVRMSKEIQLHMWVSLIERVAKFSRGTITGGIVVRTRRLVPG